MNTLSTSQLAELDEFISYRAWLADKDGDYAALAHDVSSYIEALLAPRYEPFMDDFAIQEALNGDPHWFSVWHAEVSDIFEEALREVE